MLAHIMRLSLIVGLVLAAAPPPAWTETPDERADRLESEVEQLRAAIERLKESTTQPDRLAEIERQIAILAEEIENLKIGDDVVVVEGDSRVAGLAPAAAKVYRKQQGLSIGGYGEALLEVFDDRRDDGTPSGKTDTFDLLRGIVYVGYKFNDSFVFNSEIEWEHASTSKEGSASVEFAYVDYLYRPGVSFRGGLLLSPMGLVNEVHEPTTFLGAKRPQTETRIIPSTWRENGFGIHGELGGLTYRTYVMNGLDASGFSASGLRGGRQKGSKAKAEDFAWVGRLDWTETPGLVAGVSAYVGDSGQGLTTADGSPIGAATTIWEAHVDWRIRGLELRALIARSEVDDVAELNDALGLEGSESVGEEMEGAYLQIGWDLLAHRQGARSLTPYLRWESVDTQKQVPEGFEYDAATDVEILTLGVAYQPIEQIILKLDYQDIDDAAGTGVDQVNVALGYIF